MSVESTTETQNGEEMALLQDTLDSEHIAFVETLDAEIKTVIEQASTLQRYDYVIGTIDDSWISQKDNHHFELVHHNEETNKVDQIHCVIFDSRRSSITTDITEGRQVAVTGTVSFHPPKGNGSIIVEEVVPIETDSSQRLYEAIPVRVWIAIAAVIVIVLGLAAYLILG